MSPEQIVKFLRSRRFRVNAERQTQDDIATELEKAGIPFDRECRLSGADIVDFLLDGTAVEVKVKGSTLDIYRQLERYATHLRVQAIVLASSVALSMPPEIGGKPVFVVNLGRAWL